MHIQCLPGPKCNHDVQNAFPYTHIVCFNNEVKIYATESSKEIQQNSFFLKKQKFIWSPFISEDC